jgi:hypothetical protein
VQTVREVHSDLPERIVFVVDGSATMAEHLDAIARAVTAVPAEMEVRLLVAGDKVIDFAAELTESSEVLAERLSAVAGRGGCDNVSALVRACGAAAERRGAVIWVHGPQPVLLDPLDPLLQRAERMPGRVRIYDLQVASGPNRIAEAPEMLGAIVPVPFAGKVEDDLVRLTSRLLGREKRIESARAQAPTETRASAKGSDHLARLWARDRVLELSRGGAGDRQEAVALASKYQFVTPVTGAVVLETQAQYDAAKLRPVDPDTVPTIPEPEIWALLAVVLSILAIEVWRRGRRWRFA